MRSFRTLNDLSNRLRVWNKTEDLNSSIFNMIPGINESKTLKWYVSWKFECTFDRLKCNSNQ